MKKILLIIISNILFSFYLMADIRGNLDKGTFFYGNSLTMEIGKSETNISTNGGVDSKSELFNIDGKLGYFILDQLEIGLEVSSSSVSIEYEDDTKKEVNSSFLGIQTMYFIELYRSFNPYIGFSYGHYQQTQSTYLTRVKISGPEMIAKIGINFFLNEIAALDVGFNYVHIETNEDEESDVNSEFNSYNTKIGINLFLK